MLPVLFMLRHARWICVLPIVAMLACGEDEAIGKQCTRDTPCPDGLVCETPLVLDKGPSNIGFCGDPEDCKADKESVCGDDGRWYESECAAYAAGHGLGSAAKYSHDDTSVLCGWKVCAGATTYCRLVINDVNGLIDFVSCDPLPATCAGISPPSCSCTADTECGQNCEVVAGGLRLLCASAD